MSRRRRAYLIANPAEAAACLEDALSSLQVTKVALHDLPPEPPDAWLTLTQFGEASVGTCTEAEWEAAVAQPLRFSFLAAQAMLRRMKAGSGSSIVLIGLASDGNPAMSEIGFAALECFVRSLSIETGPFRMKVHGFGLPARGKGSYSGKLVQHLLIEAAGLPSGSWLNLSSLPVFRRAEVSEVATDHGEAKPTISAKSKPVAVITGAARGLGRAMAQRLAEQGDAVVLLDQDASALCTATQEIARAGGTTAWLEGDVSRRSDLEGACQEALSRWGRLDVWINNAGICIRGSIAELPVTNWDRTLDVNLKGALWGSQLALSAMKRGGAILNISSTAARSAGLVFPGCYNAYAPYATSKAGLEALTRVFAREAAPRRVRVNALAPGPILTDLTRQIYTPKRCSELERHIPLGRLGEPQDVAAAAAFLVSEGAAFVTGQVLSVDGGLTRSLEGA